MSGCFSNSTSTSTSYNHYNHHNNHCKDILGFISGPTGSTGATGPTGVTGPTGPTGPIKCLWFYTRQIFSPDFSVQNIVYILPIPTNSNYALVTFDNASGPDYLGTYVLNLTNFTWVSSTSSFSGATGIASGENTTIAGYNNTMYTGSLQGYLNQVDVTNPLSINSTNDIDFVGNISSNFENITSISLNTDGTRAYIACSGGIGTGTTGGYLIMDITGVIGSWMGSNIKAYIICSSNIAANGTYFVDLNARYGSGTSACAVFTTGKTGVSNNNILSYDVSSDTFVSLSQIVNVSGSDFGQITGHPQDSSIMYVNAVQNQNTNNSAYLWIIQINSNGTMSILNQILCPGIMTSQYVSGNFVTYNSVVYYMINSDDGYFTLFDATNPSMPVIKIMTNPYGFSAPVIEQVYINPTTFNIYVCNDTDDTKPTVQLLQLLTNVPTFP